MKHKIITCCLVALTLCVAAVPALAAGQEQYPIEVQEYMEGDNPRIKKVYQLSLNEDPAGIPTGDFERDGRLYFLLDMTRKDEVGVDTQPYTETITLESNTGKLEEVLKRAGPGAGNHHGRMATRAPWPWTTPALLWRRRAMPPRPGRSPPPEPIPICPTLIFR